MGALVSVLVVPCLCYALLFNWEPMKPGDFILNVLVCRTTRQRLLNASVLNLQTTIEQSYK